MKMANTKTPLVPRILKRLTTILADVDVDKETSCGASLVYEFLFLDWPKPMCMLTRPMQICLMFFT